ncbi:MAG: APC family permease [Rhodospirillales bacterium]
MHRDQGLVRGIGALGMAANIVNGVVGAGIFTLPAAVALSAGAAAPAAYIICAVVMAAVVVCFAEAGSRVPTSGGVYGTAEAAFGPATAFVAGMLLLVSDVLASGGIAAALADMVGVVAPALATGAGRIAVIAVLYALATGANLLGVRRTARLIEAATCIKIVPLLLFLGFGLLSIGLPAPPGPPTTPISAAGFGRAMVMTLFAFSGMETALMASGEVRNPARSLPRALFLGMLAILVLYVGVQLTAQHLLGSGLAQAAAPLAEGAARFGPWARGIMLAGAGVSMMAWMASDVLGTSRLLFAFGRDGRLPAWFGRLGRATRVPVNAIGVYVAVAFTLAVSGSFLELIVLSSLAVVGIYSIQCACAFVLQRRCVALAGPPLGMRAVPAAAVAGMVGMGGMLLAAQWVEVAGLAAVVLASLALYSVTKREP